MRIWKVSPGRNADTWFECSTNNVTSINWINHKSYLDFKDRKQLTKYLKKVDQGKSGSTSTIWRFVYEISPGDVVVANDGLSRVVGIGVVKSSYLPPNDSKNPHRGLKFHRHIRLVDWAIKLDIDDSVYLGAEVFNQPTLQELNEKHCTKIRHAFRKQRPKLLKMVERLFQSSDILLDDASEPNDDYYVPSGRDDRDRVFRQIAARRGQQKFREAISRRASSRCQVTGCNVLALLEASHIQPYKGENDNQPSNGLLLRADIHTLFDLNLIGIHPKTHRIEINRKLIDDPVYKKLVNMTLKTYGHRPSEIALKKRYVEFQKNRKNT